MTDLLYSLIGNNVESWCLGDAEDFELNEFDTGGKAIAALEDTRPTFPGAPDGKHEEMCGVPVSRLKVKVFVQDRAGLKHLLQQVDLAVMPSRTEGFILTGFEAVSAGLPVLVSRNSGFGEALSSVAFGSAFVIESEDPATLAIPNIWSKNRECRLEEAVTLRDFYARKYNWAKQTKELVDWMINLTHGWNIDYLFLNGTLSGNDGKTKQTKMRSLSSFVFKSCKNAHEFLSVWLISGKL